MSVGRLESEENKENKKCRQVCVNEWWRYSRSKDTDHSVPTRTRRSENRNQDPKTRHTGSLGKVHDEDEATKQSDFIKTTNAACVDTMPSIMQDGDT